MKRALQWRKTEGGVSMVSTGLACCSLAGAFIVLAASIAPAAPAPAARDLVRAMLAAERTISYAGTQVTARTGSPPVSSRIWRDGAKRRLEYTSPPIVNGDVLVNNGTDVWLYHRAERSAVQTRAMSGRSAADLANAAPGAKLLGTGKTAGRTAWIVSIKPPANRAGTMKIWIDRATKARLRMERYGTDGKRLVAVALQKVRFGDVPASRFTWQTPAGVQLTRTGGRLYRNEDSARRVATWLHWPSYLPKGYRFESAIVDKKDIWLRYSNGLTRFSIFQQSAGSQNKALQQVGDSWYWQSGGIRYLLVGLSRAEVAKVANGLK